MYVSIPMSVLHACTVEDLLTGITSASMSEGKLNGWKPEEWPGTALGTVTSPAGKFI